MLHVFSLYTDQLHACTQQLLSELEVLTKIQPHENICNLLASCTSPGKTATMLQYVAHCYSPQSTLVVLLYM